MWCLQKYSCCATIKDINLLRFKRHMGFLEKLVKEDSLKLSKLPACIFGNSYALKAHASRLLKCEGSICHRILQSMSCILPQVLKQCADLYTKLNAIPMLCRDRAYNPCSLQHITSMLLILLPYSFLPPEELKSRLTKLVFFRSRCHACKVLFLFLDI